MPSFGCKALCIVMSFLVLMSICGNSSLVHFKNGPEYITRRTAQVFIILMKFLLQSLVSRSFLVWLRNSFLILSFISACMTLSAFSIPKNLSFSLFPNVLILSSFRQSLQLYVFFCFSLLAWGIFYARFPLHPRVLIFFSRDRRVFPRNVNITLLTRAVNQ